MYENDLSKDGSTEAVTKGGSTVWTADSAAVIDIVFPAGAAGDQTCWTYQVTFASIINVTGFKGPSVSS